MKYLLGYDIGSSSVKAALLEIETGKAVASAFSPVMEMRIDSHRPGFAEQEPEMWWTELVNATGQLHKQFSFKGDEVAAIGVSYQMHGLVCVDKQLKPLRPSIIWCDSRAVKTGNKAFKDLGQKFCLKNFLNSPGNFTASKLRWVKKNEPAVYEKIYKIMLPGDFIAMKLTGEPATTVSGLSEGILWNFKKEKIATELLRYYGIDDHLIPDLVPQFGEQGKLTAAAADVLKLKAGIPLCYRAGDQPNNAFSLNVLQPGEIAATAGTSGVVYGVTDKTKPDYLSRINTFVHVNHRKSKPRYGVLLCVNGAGVLNSWLRKNFFAGISYEQMNNEASEIPAGADGLMCYPFGNGAERILQNKNAGAVMKGLNFNRHHRGHIARAAQEAIVFSLYYGMEIMKETGMKIKTVRAGHANMFLSPVFTEAFANTSGCAVELFNTDGAAGAARAAGTGKKIYRNFKECFKGLEPVQKTEPGKESMEIHAGLYNKWKSGLRF